mmetsp:Transcript_19439/g.22229  ORF Transcript_19439/g.22229 Transcript_19439/m.22229 type:complete len:100 (-) Transcript_19439:775-1074(-)
MSLGSLGRFLPKIAIVGGTVLSLSTITTTAAMATTDVSSSKNIKPMLSSTTLNTESLFVPIDFALGRIQEGSPKKTASEVISQHSGRYGSIALVVRRPG